MGRCILVVGGEIGRFGEFSISVGLLLRTVSVVFTFSWFNIRCKIIIWKAQRVPQQNQRSTAATLT